MNGGFNIWAITPEERCKHDKQFDSLTPTLGYVSVCGMCDCVGTQVLCAVPVIVCVRDQARKFFLQSGLPASVLAEICEVLSPLNLLYSSGLSVSSLSLSCSPFLTDPTTPASPRALADMGRDGKMDRLEFSIAMKLIKLQLQGQPLPSSLPVIMKQTPAPAMTSSARFGKARLIVCSSSEFTVIII
ncbi:hypothetical protein NFI96_008928 [Prochilodus magdalenae]|nr:hypothetical protein NFI96_008928 [Prochilodus magdalenae]